MDDRSKSPHLVFYRGGGGLRYITIIREQQTNRICYQGFSTN